MVPLVPLVKTVCSQYCRQSTVWAKLPTLESHMIQYGFLNLKFINFTNKHCFYHVDISKNRNTEIYTYKIRLKNKLDVLINILLLTPLGLPMEPLGLPMVPLVPTFPPMVT